MKVLQAIGGLGRFEATHDSRLESSGGAKVCVETRVVT